MIRLSVVMAVAVVLQAMSTIGSAARGAELTSIEKEQLSELDSRAFHQFKNTDLARYLELRAKPVEGGIVSPARDIAGFFARRSLGQSFRLNAVQFDPAESDCVSFVNRIIALSLAPDWNSYSLLIDRIRHKDGIIEYRNRNFFTLGDWLPNNSWILDDVTAQLGGGKLARTFTHVVRPKVFVERPAAPGSKFTRAIFKGSDFESGAKEVRTDVLIPAERIAEASSDLQTGDVVLILRDAADGHLGCDHLGLVVREQEKTTFLHSAPPSVLQEDFTVFLKRCHWVVGFKFLRLKGNASEIARKEVERLQPTVQVRSPEEQDQAVEHYRARRAAKK